MESKRQLAAIMFTDIVGYTALMDDNEQKALELLKKNRGIQKPIVDRCGGRWLKEMGDGSLAIFSTITDAVAAAVAIQDACHKEQDLILRIGIHQGEVLFEGGDVFGSGVNIAARLESLAPPGGILVSEMVARSIDNKGIDAQFFGEEKLKNVKHPVRIYQLNGKTKSKDHRIESDLDVDEKSIAVLPFANLSSDPEQEYFSDGLTEELITDLSQIETLRVISRSSVMRFKASDKAIGKVARELNVIYILEGSVQKSNNHIRINVRLIQALEDRNIWSEKYSGLLDDIFSIQENVSKSIAKALRIKLNPNEKDKISTKPIKDPRAYELYQKAQFEIFRFNEAALQRALQYLDEALKFEGENPFIYGKMAIVYCHLINIADKIYQDYFTHARQLANKVFHLQPNSAIGHTIRGYIGLYDGNIGDALGEVKLAYKENPSNPDNLLLLILTNFYLGKIDEVETYCQRMQEVDPYNPVCHALVALMCYMKGDLPKAMIEIEKGYKIYPEIPQILLYYAYYLAATGHKSKALQALDQYISNTSGSIFSTMGVLFKKALENEDATGVLIVEAEEKLKIDVEWSWLVADFYSLMNQKEMALNWLEHIVNRGFINYSLLAKFDPFLENIRSEPRFAALMKRVEYLDANN